MPRPCPLGAGQTHLNPKRNTPSLRCTEIKRVNPIIGCDIACDGGGGMIKDRRDSKDRAAPGEIPRETLQRRLHLCQKVS